MSRPAIAIEPLAAFLDTGHPGAEGEPVTLLGIALRLWSDEAGESSACVVVRVDGRIDLAPLDDITIDSAATLRARALARLEGWAP